MAQFSTVIERNAGRVSLANEIFQQELPRDCYLFLDIGPVIRGMINRRSGSVLANTHAICQAYGGVESVEVSVEYTPHGMFNVAKIMPEFPSDGSGSDSNTTSDAGSNSVVTHS